MGTPPESAVSGRTSEWLLPAGAEFYARFHPASKDWLIAKV
jgi:hypothetical protein